MTWGLVLAALGGLATPIRAQKGYRPPPSYLQLGKPDQQEGRKILEEFRQQGIQGDYYLAFELRVLPRRGDEQVRRGALWGSRNADGPISRVDILAPENEATGLRLLIQSGADAALWRWSGAPGAAIEKQDVASLFSPVAGTDLTAFDLQMPFLYWPDFVYEGLARMHGRPAHQFLFYPPKEFTAEHPQLTGVRVYLDTQYMALVQAELIGEGGRSLKVVSLLDLKKIGDQWLVKAIDLRDESTRNKTRFVVTAAGLNRQFSPAVFEPAALATPLPSPPDLVQLATP